ncbi:hypothetical protein A2U01_0069009, partial [Trifolium medium]|nr:hypothetical protein [Trifolium medium]
MFWEILPAHAQAWEVAPRREKLGSILPAHAQAWEAAPRRSACEPIY